MPNPHRDPLSWFWTPEGLTKIIGICRSAGVAKLHYGGLSLELGPTPTGERQPSKDEVEDERATSDDMFAASGIAPAGDPRFADE